MNDDETAKNWIRGVSMNFLSLTMWFFFAFFGCNSNHPLPSSGCHLYLRLCFSAAWVYAHWATHSCYICCPKHSLFIVDLSRLNIDVARTYPLEFWAFLEAWNLISCRVFQGLNASSYTKPHTRRSSSACGVASSRSRRAAAARPPSRQAIPTWPPSSRSACIQ